MRGKADNGGVPCGLENAFLFFMSEATDTNWGTKDREVVHEGEPLSCTYGFIIWFTLKYIPISLISQMSTDF